MFQKVIRKLIAVLVFMPALVLSAPGIETVILEDAADVPSAVAALTDSLEKQGFTLPLTINHSGAAASVGLDLDPNQVIFARPPRGLEKFLLFKSATVGIDLPFKFHIYEDDGDIKLAVNSIGYLIDRHQMSIHDFVLRYTDRLIGQFGTEAETGVETVPSDRSIEGTVQALQDAIAVNPDARIPLVLRYGDRAAKANDNKLHRRRPSHSLPILVVFGNPNVGTPLMQSDPKIGIDLPLEFLVWKSREGQVNISYNNIRFIADRFELVGQDPLIAMIANALRNLAAAGAGQSQE